LKGERAMFFKKECGEVARLCEAKIHDTLDAGDKLTDLEYIQTLITLVSIKNAAEEKVKTAF